MTACPHANWESGWCDTINLVCLTLFTTLPALLFFCLYWQYFYYAELGSGKSCVTCTWLTWGRCQVWGGKRPNFKYFITLPQLKKKNVWNEERCPGLPSKCLWSSFDLHCSLIPTQTWTLITLVPLSSMASHNPQVATSDTPCKG